MNSEDKMVFAREKEDEHLSGMNGPAWKLLIVDDDTGVHDVSKQVLRNFQFNNRPLEILSAFSGAQAIEVLNENPDIAVVLLDVVMESNEAGLKVAEHIRVVLKNHLIRIILRTGQPGRAPEKRIILDYQINDYKEKTELTATKLYTSIITSLRDFSSLIHLDRCIKAYEKVADSVRALQLTASLERYAEETLKQAIVLLEFDAPGHQGNTDGCALLENRGEIRLVGGTGRYADPEYLNGIKAIPENILDMARKSVMNKNHLSDNGFFVGYIPSERMSENCLIWLQGKSVAFEGLRILNSFFTYVHAGLDNMLELTDLRRRCG